ncbi:MAG: hypothetical protein GY781_22510 [Gammaproteobacteria bacterium]|nr:hypothetical protein [Gammaproteobacteria bacterium]
MLRQKDETKNEKKIAEIEIEIITSELFSDFKTVPVSEQEDLLLYHPRTLLKNMSPVIKKIRFLKPNRWPFNTIFIGLHPPI